MSVRSDADLEAAFEADGFQVERTERYNGARGMLARSTTDSSKIALYIEGAPTNGDTSWATWPTTRSNA